MRNTLKGWYTSIHTFCRVVLTPDQADHLVEFDQGVSSDSGCSHTTFGGNTVRIGQVSEAEVKDAWLGPSRVTSPGFVDGSKPSVLDRDLLQRRR